MDVVDALAMRDSFARTAAEELAEDRFPEGEREKILSLFKDALEKGAVDLERILPKMDAKLALKFTKPNTPGAP